MTFSQNLKAARKSRGFTLQELADKSCSSKSYIWELESGKNPLRPSGLKLAVIARALGVTMEYLMKDDPIPDELRDAKDNAFFNSYKEMPESIKRQIREIAQILESKL